MKFPTDPKTSHQGFPTRSDKSRMYGHRWLKALKIWDLGCRGIVLSDACSSAVICTFSFAYSTSIVLSDARLSAVICTFSFAYSTSFVLSDSRSSAVICTFSFAYSTSIVLSDAHSSAVIYTFSFAYSTSIVLSDSCSSAVICTFVFMPPTLKKWGAYCFRLVRVCVCVRSSVQKNSSEGFEISYMDSSSLSELSPLAELCPFKGLRASNLVC